MPRRKVQDSDPEADFASNWHKVQAEMAAAHKQQQANLREMRKLQREIDAKLAEIEVRSAELDAREAELMATIDRAAAQMGVDRLLIDSMIRAFHAQRQAEDGAG